MAVTDEVFKTNTIDNSINNLSSEQQALPVVNEINHIKNFILTNYS